MKKIISLIFVVLVLASLCACSSTEDGEQTTTTAAADTSYEQRLYGEWKRENSDIVMMLSANHKGAEKQKGLSTTLYWEADADNIVIKKNMVGEAEAVPYTLESNTLTIHNSNGTTVVYKKIK